MINQLTTTSFAAALALASASQAAVSIQELFDGAPLDTSINGWGGSATAIGQTGIWATNGNANQKTANNFNVDGSTLPGLPSNAGAQGGVYNGTGNYGTNIYATRALAAAIDFNVDRELFFSVRLRNAGDTAMGIGLAAGANGSAEFVGAGFSWNNYTGGNGNAAYIAHGTLDGARGVYEQAAAEAASSVNGYGLLVGRISISSAGNDLIDIKRYAENSTIDELPNVTWSAHSEVDSSMSASHLLLWMNGTGNGELDAIRFGDSWQSVTGVPEPSAALLGGLGVLALLRRRRK